ncbi:MAG: hypothetical protein JW963_11005 [Anaerolineales bacterium]|nr:hypothetical protein [Anaerolineales bacterium]
MKGLDMGPFHEYVNEYRKQLEKGAIQVAYRGLMEYMMGLRTHFIKKYPDYVESGSIYYGYMDMTYFSVFPKSFKARKLKLPIVFLHEAFRFEVWLSGVNRQVQEKYWNLINESKWNKYKLVSQEGKGVDSILEHILVDNPDFSDLDALTQQIEAGTLNFIQDVENFLSEHSTG